MSWHVQMQTLCYFYKRDFISYKGFDHPQTWVSTGFLETVTQHTYRGLFFLPQDGSPPF